MIRGLLPAVSDVMPTVLKSSNVLSCSYNVVQTRNTVVVKRKHPIKLGKLGRLPTIPKRGNIYEFVTHVHSKPLPDIKCILTETVAGVGIQGELVEIKRSLFRNQLYPLKKAIYASPENLAEYEAFRSERGETDKLNVMSKFAELTIKELAKLYLPVPMSGDTTWSLNQQHIRLALRKVGVEAEENAISLPEKPVTTPQEFTFQITVSPAPPVDINAHVYPIYKDTSKNTQELPEVWRKEYTEKQK